MRSGRTLSERSSRLSTPIRSIMSRSSAVADVVNRQDGGRRQQTPRRILLRHQVDPGEVDPGFAFALPGRHDLRHRLRVVPVFGREQGDEHLRDRAADQVADDHVEDFRRRRSVVERAARLIQDAGFFQRTLNLVEQQIVVHHDRSAVGNRIQVARVAAGELSRAVIGDEEAAERLVLRAQVNQRQRRECSPARSGRARTASGRSTSRRSSMNRFSASIRSWLTIRLGEINRRGVQADVEQFAEAVFVRQISRVHIRRERFERALNRVGDLVLAAGAAEVGRRAVERGRFLQRAFGTLQQIAVVERDGGAVVERAQELFAFRREVLRLIVR